MSELLLANQVLLSEHFIKIGVLYFFIGAWCMFVLYTKRQQERSAFDMLLLLALWPLYGPLLFMSKGAPPERPKSAHAEAFLAAVRRAEGTPLAKFLPDKPEIQRLSERLRIASDKITEIDLLLARQEFSHEATLARVEELRQKKASARAISTAMLRLQNIERLQRMKQRSVEELDEVEELLAQLTAQAEVTRLAGASDESASELVKELLQRVEAFGQALDEVPGMIS
jgi:hypothetical protein